MSDNRPSEEPFSGLTAITRESFPKRCANCGAEYATVEDYVKKTEEIKGQSGLSRGYDDDGNPIVELFRNCACGSTLMDSFNDRRDAGEGGILRRTQFMNMLKSLMHHGLQEGLAREQLLKVLKGERSEVLENLGIKLQIVEGGIDAMDRRQDIITALQKGMDDTFLFFNSLTPGQLRTRVYQDGANWTAQQVVAHFVTIERSMHWLFNNILLGGEGSPDEFDIDRFNLSQTRKMEGLDLPSLLAQFKTVRQETIAIVERMTDSDLDREGRHPFHGNGRLERFIRWAYEHVRIHEEEIRKVFQ